MSDSNIEHNTARGGTGGNGGNGGNGLGGGLALQAGARATVNDSTIEHNKSTGGEGGVGGSDGHGLGGGVSDLGTFSYDVLTDIVGNHASTSSDNIYS